MSVPEEMSLAGVAAVLSDAGTSCAVVEEPPLRIVTERDLARAWAHGHTSETAVTEIATGAPVWATTETAVVAAGALMIDGGIRHLIVVDPGGLAVGIVSIRDLFEVLLRSHEPSAIIAGFAAVLMRSPGR